jgi:hypothetical protein
MYSANKVDPRQEIFDEKLTNKQATTRGKLSLLKGSGTLLPRSVSD